MFEIIKEGKDKNFEKFKKFVDDILDEEEIFENDIELILTDYAQENDLSYSEVLSNPKYREYVLSKIDRDKENEEDKFYSEEPDKVTRIDRFGDEFWEVDEKGNKKKFCFKARETKLNESINDKVYQKAKARFEDLCNTMGKEYLLYEEGGIEGWTLRDFVAEADYESQFAYEVEDRQEGAKWKRFVNTYAKYLTDDIKCKTGHCSEKYDLK